jgi:hypothetical protein
MLPKPVAASVAGPDLRPDCLEVGAFWGATRPLPCSAGCFLPRFAISPISHLCPAATGPGSPHPGDEAVCHPKHAGRGMGRRDRYRFATPVPGRQSPEGLRGKRLAKRKMSENRKCASGGYPVRTRPALCARPGHIPPERVTMAPQNAVAGIAPLAP